MIAKFLFLLILTNCFVNAQNQTEESEFPFFKDNILRLREAVKEANKIFTTRSGNCGNHTNHHRHTKPKQHNEVDKIIDEYLTHMQDKNVFESIDKAINHHG